MRICPQEIGRVRCKPSRPQPEDIYTPRPSRCPRLYRPVSRPTEENRRGSGSVLRKRGREVRGHVSHTSTPAGMEKESSGEKTIEGKRGGARGVSERGPGVKTRSVPQEEVEQCA
ncbi:hypothetical protein DPEC_G00065370 [Dallia pectoralis]|uniref:Uncharacterized protein n=1 Tax=Dallia pectoralis TaxID=75939 RepID=A0ACC2H8N6_DALPE|nr:hypothetical protein DPEC_G00065370 [Dallia pectoralis]